MVCLIHPSVRHWQVFRKRNACAGSMLTLNHIVLPESRRIHERLKRLVLVQGPGTNPYESRRAAWLVE